ncbi:MAG: hypothetical protein WBP93_22145, partial [Pyrinomonadaceae bacterium]
RRPNNSSAAISFVTQSNKEGKMQNYGLPQLLTTIISFISLLISLYAVLKVTKLNKTNLVVSAADRALQRFNRINEVLFNHPELNDVFIKSYNDLNPTARGFAWYILNQFEVIYLDYHFGLLPDEYFMSYANWMSSRLERDSALKDLVKDIKREKSFSDSYLSYLRGLSIELQLQIK